MAKSTSLSIDQAYEEPLSNAASPRKNLHAFISHLYPPFYIQVMEAFANYQPLDYEHIVLNPSIQQVVATDTRSSSSNSFLYLEPTALKPLIRQVANMDSGNSFSQNFAWDEATTSSSSGASGWTSWSTPETCDLRERINHHFVEFTDPLEFPPYARSSVVYPYVPIDLRRSLEENLLVAWYTSSMPTKIMHATQRPEEAQGYSPSFLAKKAKICSSDWLDYINAFVPSAPVPSPIIEASTPSSPSSEAEAFTPSSASSEAEPSTPSPPPTLSWTEKLRLALPMEKVFPPYKPPPSPTPTERKEAQLLLAAFSHLPFNVLEDEVPLKNLRWACDILTRGHVLNPLAQAELHMFLDQLPVLLYWHRNSLVTVQSLDQLSSLRIHAQYEAENFIEEFDDFKNKDSAYWDDLVVDEVEQRLREEAFEVKAEELYYEVRAHQLMQPTLEEIEDIIKKEQKFIDHCWAKFHDLVIYSIPYFYELEFIPR